MKTSIEALHREVSDLQSKTNISAIASGDSAAATVPTYARVASNRNVLHQKQQPHSRRKRVADKPVNASSANTMGSDNRNHNHAKQERVAVLGVRRIWGTLKHTSTTSVSSTLNKLITLGNYLTVKKKVRLGGNHWWFLVKGSEDVFKRLEGEWERVSLQISRKLEPCTMPKHACDSNPHDLSPAVADAQANTVSYI